MGKYKAGFNLKGELSVSNGRFLITTIENKGKDSERAVTYDMTSEFLKFVDHTITVGVSEDIMIEPIDEDSLI